MTGDFSPVGSWTVVEDIFISFWGGAFSALVLGFIALLLPKYSQGILFPIKLYIGLQFACAIWEMISRDISGSILVYTVVLIPVIVGILSLRGAVDWLVEPLEYAR